MIYWIYYYYYTILLLEILDAPKKALRQVRYWMNTCF